MKLNVRIHVYILITLSFLLLISPFSSAWTSYTHNWICAKAGLADIDCAAPDTPALQSKFKDVAFKNHHCTNNSEDCAARKIADKYMIQSYPEAREISAHLYADSMVPVHWYSTDYDTCHKIFEDKVEEKLRNVEDNRYTLLGQSYDLSSWNVSMQCVAKEGKVNRTVELYADNIYMMSVAKYVSEKMYTEYKLTIVKDHDLTPVLAVLLVFIILIFILFIYFGLRNRKHNRK